MSEYEPRGPFTPDARDLTAVEFGVPVGFIGEDGELLMLGHVEPRKALAVIMRHARRDSGLWPEEVLGRDKVADALAAVELTYAVFSRHSSYCDDLQSMTADELAHEGYLDEGEAKREVCSCDEFAWWAHWVNHDAPLTTITAGGGSVVDATPVTRYVP